MNTMLDELLPTMIRMTDVSRDVDRNLEALVADLIAKYPKRRGELRAEYEWRILRLARKAK